MQIESSNNSKEKNFSKSLNIKKENVLCKDGFCKLPIKNENPIINKNEVNLLTPLMDDRSKTLMRAIDHTNNKYGRHAITIASAGIHKGWKMRREHSSKIDTASFNYLPKVSAS